MTYRHRSRVRRALVLAACTVAALILPRHAAAQKDPFVDALIAFRTALAGSFGDEGPQVTGALERMTASLAEWDRMVAGTEAELRARLPAAMGEEALRLRTTLASLLLERGRYRDALAEIDAAIALDGDRAAFHLFRGLIREAGDNVDAAAALEDFRRAWTLDTADPIKAYLVADRSLAAGAPEDPKPQVDALLAAQQREAALPLSFIQFPLIADSAADWPVVAPAAYADGFELIARGRYAEALASFRASAARDPLVVDAAARTAPMADAIARLRASDFSAAVARLEQVVVKHRQSSEAHRILGIAYKAAGRHADAIPPLQEAVRLAPGDERAQLALGRELMEAGQVERAEAALRAALDLLPRSADLRLALADLYERDNRGADAIRELEAVTTLPAMAGKGQLYWRLADIYHRHQDFDSVTRALSARARLDPNKAVVHKDLGLAQMRRGAREEALVALLMSTLLGGDDADTLASLGQIHLEMGRYEAAEPVLRKAVALSPALAQARFALGTTLVRVGKTAEGREQLAEFQRLRNAALDQQRRHFEEVGRQRAAPAASNP